jgi:transposase
MEQRKRFTRDFKLKVLGEFNSGKSAAELSRQYEIHPNVILRWQREFRSNPKAAFAGHGNTWKLEAKLAERERLIGQLYAENALLKKAIADEKAYLAEQRRLRRAGGLT